MATGAPLLVLILALVAHGLKAALPPLPDKLNVDSTVIVIDARLNRTGLFQVEEFISRTEGSIKLSVLDVSESGRGKNKRDYFRLLEHEPHENRGERDNRLVTYDPKENRCAQEQTNTWQLADFTQLLNGLIETNEETLRTDLIAHDRTSIGPAGLLQIVYDNAEKFTYETKSFDFLHLTDALYFTLRFSLKQHDQDKTNRDSSRVSREAKLVVAVAKQHVDTDAHDGDLLDRIKMGNTRLSELSSLGHITAIGLVVDDSPADSDNESWSLVDMRSPELLDFGTNPLPKSAAGLIVSYTLIQERSLAHHVGTADSIFDLFLLPSGIGCGYVSAHRPIYLTARQFSGKFESSDHPDEHFVAFDESSLHFRFDSNQGKFIYSLRDKTVTLIRAESDSSGTDGLVSKEKQANGAQITKEPYNRFLSQQEEVASSNGVHEYQTHCAQASLMDEHELLGMKTMSDVLGAGGDRVGLMYLGSRRLEPRDELSLRVHVYEREIFHAQIPLLIRLNLCKKPRVAMTKYTLVFYFVDEASPRSAEEGDVPSFEAIGMGALEDTMWLKRLELVSANSILKYQSLEARLTFDRFSWSLESIAEETRDRHSKLMHPSRTFDMLECWPARAHTQLDALLELAPGDVSGESAVATATTSGSGPVQQIESLEETLLQFLVEQIEFPRSYVSDFELVDESASSMHFADTLGYPGLGAVQTSKTDDDTTKSLLMRAKLTMPFNHYYNSMYLVGWVRSLPALLHANQAELVAVKTMMPHHECALVLATKWATLRLPSSFYMLQCPLVGCAMINAATKLEQLVDFVREREQPSPAISTENYENMCEVHMIRRSYTGTALVSERFRPDRIAPKLKRAKPRFESAYFGAPTREDRIGAISANWTGQIKEVMLDTGAEADMRDEQLVSGLCYGLTTKLTRKVYPNQTEELHQRFVLLDLDKHHSRIHCHRACMLYQFCNTYSYSVARRQCTLSDVTREQIHDPAVHMDQNRPYDCTIHALNQFGLFARRPFIMFVRPMDLIARENVVLGLSIEDCARFCRHNELIFEPSEQLSGGDGKKVVIGCQGFSYIRLMSLCVLEPATRRVLEAELERDKQRVNRLAKTSDLEQYFGDHNKGKLSETEAQESYKRDYTQYYAVKNSFGLELRQPVGVLQVESAVSKMEDLDLVECARECTIIRRTCVTFDHCAKSVNGRYTNLCYLYNIRAPMTIPGSLSSATAKMDSAKLEAKLSPLEAYFYIANRSSEHWVSLEAKDHCTHYYLDGDQLYLKRRLNVAARSFHEDDKPLIEGLEHKSSDRRGESITDTSVEHLGRQEHTGEPDLFGQLCVQMLAGILLGAMLFMVQPKIGQAASHLGVSEMVENLWRRHTMRRNERSMSQVEITEMVDIH